MNTNIDENKERFNKEKNDIEKTKQTIINQGN